MEINLIPVGTYPLGAVAQIDVVEGRFVVFTSNAHEIDFGSQSDLPGIKLPENDTQAQQAKYCVTWTAPDRVVSPGNLYFVPTPSYSFALRGGFDQTANLPMTNVTVRTTWPGNQESVTIPSGTKVIVLGPDSVVTLPSGQYVYNSSLETPGARLEILNTDDDTTDSGKPGYSATGTIAEVVRFDDSDSSLTIRIL